jgi:hypothetical protein
MVVSFIHPHTCGFAKAEIWRFTKDAVVNIKRVDTETPYQHRVRTVQAIHELFCQMFGREEVGNYPDNMVINWSGLARKHDIKNTQGEIAKNGGQIAEEWLKSVGFDVNRFKRKLDGNDAKVRRKKLREHGGEITVAVPQTTESVKGDMKENILSGEYTVGQQIVPRKVCINNM